MLSLVPRRPLPDSPEKMVSCAPELEVLPIVAQRVLAIAHGERTSARTMVRLFGTDQALASAILRPMLDRGLPPYALPGPVAWRHAATASVGARRLGQLLGLPSSEEASVAGLLHDVGKAVLSSVAPEVVAEAVSIARSRRLPVWQAETLVLGFDHGAVGAALLRSWGLPESVAEAVAFHHRPGESPAPLATVVSLADAAAHAVGAVGGGGACPQPEWDPAAALLLGASAEQIALFLEELQCVEVGEF